MEDSQYKLTRLEWMTLIRPFTNRMVTFWNEVLVHKHVTESMPMAVFGLRVTTVLPMLNDVFLDIFRLASAPGRVLSTNRDLAILRRAVLQPGMLSETA